eukprot:CAMPEP_0113614218 /NCGR_PEP_ID=MMETSP0017_2-20120614/7048_1 /TAXON_ID=2856 /ORGANISM="Cylindrotheca closterium" /LENGTH=872 /DNA_ID=CAMNT_0000523369 /DNA_START=40 /DNA_END=2658 /DNA_ORIENTATION=+ /assembly_acc=CAM_ASM_000147
MVTDTKPHDEEYGPLNDLKPGEESTTSKTQDDGQQDDEEGAMIMPSIKPQEDEQDPMQILVGDLQEKMSTMQTRLKRNENARVRRRSSSILRPSLGPMFSSSMMSLHSELGLMAEDDDENEVRAFPHSTVSFLLLAKWPLYGHSTPESTVELSEGGNFRLKHRSRDYLCLPFWFSFAIVVLQFGVYVLALYTAANFNNPENPLDFPVNVDPYTRTAEFIAVVITVYTQNNIFQGLDLFVQSFKYIGKVPGVTVYKCYLGALTQVNLGIFGIFVTFVLIMQAQDVVDLLLDFTAMEFVACLDDAAFLLAWRGFFGRAMKDTAIVVAEVKYTPKDKHKWLRKWPLFVVLLLLLGCYALIRIMQDNRMFGDNEIYIQFHDDAIPWLSTLSGMYIGCYLSASDYGKVGEKTDSSVGRIIYTKLPSDECEDNWMSEHAAFFYCDESWVLAVGDDMMHPCDQWTLKSFKASSQDIDAYDILAHSTDLWFAKDEKNISKDGVLEVVQFLASFVPVEHFDLVCNDLASIGFVFTFPIYERLDIFIGDRPVYYADTELLENEVNGEYIIYSGRRWLAIREKDLHLDCISNCSRTSIDAECRTECLRSFDLYASNYTVHLISDPLDLRTNADTWVPTDDLRWYVAEGHGRSSKPHIVKQNLVAQLDSIPTVLEAGSAKNATYQELVELEELFVPSANLHCECDDKHEEDCYGILYCPDGGTKVWIDLKTDSHAHEIHFLVTELEFFHATLLEAAKVHDYLEWGDLRKEAEGYEVLNDTGFFDWHHVQSGSFEHLEEYRYVSCLPKDECGVIYFEDTFGDGIANPGSFEVYANGKAVHGEGETDLVSKKNCAYHFGETCETEVICSDRPLNIADFLATGFRLV